MGTLRQRSRKPRLGLVNMAKSKGAKLPPAAHWECSGEAERGQATQRRGRADSVGAGAALKVYRAISGLIRVRAQGRPPISCTATPAPPPKPAADKIEVEMKLDAQKDLRSRWGGGGALPGSCSLRSRPWHCPWPSQKGEAAGREGAPMQRPLSRGY